MKTEAQRHASDLRAVAKSFVQVDTDLGTVENAVKAQAEALRGHEQKDADRFLQLHQGQANLEHRFEFLEMTIEVMRDEMIEGFRKLGALVRKRDPNEVTPDYRRGKNGS